MTLPELKEILQETLGVFVYQEQVMQAANKLAGYSLGEADLLRRAMGKKKAEEMAAQRERFVQGATQRGYPQKKIEKIFDLIPLRKAFRPCRDCHRRTSQARSLPADPSTLAEDNRSPSRRANRSKRGRRRKRSR